MTVLRKICFSGILIAALAGMQLLPVYAEEVYREEPEIKIQVKATVPEDFVEPVSLKYEGKNRKDNEVDIVLDYEHGYMTVITVPRDLYTLKHNSTAQGYTADCVAAFTTEETDPEHTYWLPVTVNTDNGAGHEDEGLLNLLVRADFKTEDFDGSDINVKYSGTKGNLIIADLNAENGYQTVIQIMKDIYTKEVVSTSDGFYAVAQYSFDLRNAASENYLLDIVMEEGTDLPEDEGDIEQVLLPEETEDSLKEIETDKEDETESKTQKMVFEIANAEAADISGSVYVAYAGDNYAIEMELNEANNYSKTLTEPYDTYELLYITCYEDESLVFETSHEIIQADGSDVMIPVRIFVQDSGASHIKYAWLAAAVLVGLAIVYLLYKKRNRKKKDKDSGNEKESFDESLYREDDDLDLELDDE